MTFTQHTLQLVPTAGSRVVERVEIVTQRPRRGAPVFHAPTLPTPQQLNGEVPFTENLRSLQPRAR